MILDTLLSPAGLSALAARDLRGSACVVFDILRATSTFVTALHHGANKIIPVSEIFEAVALRKKHSAYLLAGERDGLRIRAALSGGFDFDFGNSPREFTPEKVRGQTIVSTTTNGTRALRAVAGAKLVLAGSFLNLSATADFLLAQKPEEILLVCAGTGEETADEDVLAAGALAERLVGSSRGDDRTAPRAVPTTNTTETALKSFQSNKENLFAALSRAKNGARLLAIPELREDVAFCARVDVFPLVAALSPAGALSRV